RNTPLAAPDGRKTRQGTPEILRSTASGTGLWSRFIHSRCWRTRSPRSPGGVAGSPRKRFIASRTARRASSRRGSYSAGQRSIVTLLEGVPARDGSNASRVAVSVCRAPRPPERASARRRAGRSGGLHAGGRAFATAQDASAGNRWRFEGVVAARPQAAPEG